jgi:hypothetical protein
MLWENINTEVTHEINSYYNLHNVNLNTEFQKQVTTLYYEGTLNGQQLHFGKYTPHNYSDGQAHDSLL